MSGGPQSAAPVPPDQALALLAQMRDQMTQMQTRMSTTDAQVGYLNGQLTTVTAQLTAAQARAEVAEKERADILKLAMSKLGSDIVDGKGVGQPFKLTGVKDSQQDFAEWDHKMLTYLRAKFGAEIEQALKWSVRQRKIIVKYPDRPKIIPRLIELAQEELEHFAETYAFMEKRGLQLQKDEPDPYVNQLLAAARHGRDERFIDRLLISSVIERRGAR